MAGSIQVRDDNYQIPHGISSQRSSTGVGKRTDRVLTSPCFSTVSQYKAYIDFAVNNTYRPLLSADDAQQYYDAYDRQCKPAYKGCTADPSTNNACASAGDTCSNAVEGPLEELANFDAYDIRASSDSFPPSTFVKWLTSSSVKKAIGATSSFASCGSTAIGNDDSKIFLPAFLPRNYSLGFILYSLSLILMPLNRQPLIPAYLE